MNSVHGYPCGHEKLTETLNDRVLLSCHSPDASDTYLLPWFNPMEKSDAYSANYI